MFSRYILILLGAMLFQHGLSQSLEGSVMLNDTTPATFATIYIPELRIGTITDQNGRYLLDEIPLGTYDVEYSHLGYRTVKRKMHIDKAKRLAHDERLEEQPIQLTDVYITPNGEDPAHYILRHVAEQASVNRKRMQRYDATLNLNFHAQDLDFIPALLPKAVNWVLKSFLKAEHMGAIYDFCSSQQQVDSRLSLVHHFVKGKTQYADERVLSSTPSMPDKVAKQLFRGTHVEIFDALYGDDLSYGRKALKKSKFNYRLLGTIEEQGMIIDVLESKSLNNDSIKETTTLYVIEDNWGILRKEVDTQAMYNRTECRDVGGGIYLPVSRVETPKMAGLDLTKDLREIMADMEKDKEEMGSIGRNIYERLRKLVESGRKLNPYTSSGYNIQYRNVVVK